jgi:hypothetical protein
VEEGYITCQKRWNETVAGIILEELTVYEWDGVCLFPAGARLRLYGNGVKCAVCPFFDENVNANGETCKQSVRL